MRFKTILFNEVLFLFLISGLTTILTISTSHAQIRTIKGTVTKVIDGDSIHITTPEQTKLKVRLYGIDAPETLIINHHTGQVNKPGQPL